MMTAIRLKQKDLMNWIILKNKKRYYPGRNAPDIFCRNDRTLDIAIPIPGTTLGDKT